MPSMFITLPDFDALDAGLVYYSKGVKSDIHFDELSWTLYKV